ncbi:MAG TPA: YicC family protein, partial [Tepidisphaeraceae bacterium]|nr:YicC family protein [Tepidisphaeraceae bacterium]
LNNRYFKPVIKLPDNLAGLEPEVETMLRERLGRGSITCILKMRTDSAEAAYHINTAALRSYVEQLERFRSGNDKYTVDLATLLALPGVCQEPRDDTDEIARHGPVVRELLTAAIDRLLQMRQREGQSLFNDLMNHLRVIGENLAQIRVRAPLVIEEYHRKLQMRVKELLDRAELKVAQIDLLKEVAVFAERADISEEIARLTHHVGQFEQSCRTGEHAGRKLDFITQEMLRQANTIASKSNDAVIAGHIVEVKGAIDRLKEQVQNVE